MTILQIFALAFIIALVAALLGTFRSKDMSPMKDMVEDTMIIHKAPKIKAPQEPLENSIEVVDVEFVEKVEAPKKKKKYYPRKPKTHL